MDDDFMDEFWIHDDDSDRVAGFVFAELNIPSTIANTEEATLAYVRDLIARIKAAGAAEERERLADAVTMAFSGRLWSLGAATSEWLRDGGKEPSDG